MKKKRIAAIMMSLGMILGMPLQVMAETSAWFDASEYLRQKMSNIDKVPIVDEVELDWGNMDSQGDGGTSKTAD